MLLINGERVVIGGGGTSVLTGDAVEGEVLAPKTFYSNDANTQLTGTMPNSTGDVLPSAVGTTIPAGYHDGTGKTTPDADLVAANIKSGVTLFGVLGTFRTPLLSIGAITGSPTVDEVITAGAVSPAGATVTYQWKRADTVGGIYSDIVGATSSTYTLVPSDSAKYIKVEATGTGVYEGTVLSAAVLGIAWFTMKVDTTKPGSASNTFIIPLPGSGVYNYDVNWGDGNIETGIVLNTSKTHVYSASGVYNVKIRGTFPQIYFSSGGDRQKLMEVINWGTVVWSTLINAFYGCLNARFLATDPLVLPADCSNAFNGCSVFNDSVDNWNTSAVVNASAMFRECAAFNKSVANFNTANITNTSNMFFGCLVFNQSLATFNTAKVTTMANMLDSAVQFNGALTNFNTAKVTTMASMFRNCAQFNQSVSSFDTALVTIMSSMFVGCSIFNQSVSNFNTAKVTTMASMFENCGQFNQSVSNFDTTLVNTMASMFRGCMAFNQSVSNFNTAAVASMSSMFNGCTIFNQSISNFNTAAVTTMGSMFLNCTAFNQSVANFNTANVATMNGMFSGCTNFNQSVASFNTAKVTTMNTMFASATNFNQDLSGFSIVALASAASMLFGTAFNTTNYDLLLVAWEAQVQLNNVAFHAGTAKYNAGAPATARAALVTSGWSITDGGQL